VLVAIALNHDANNNALASSPLHANAFARLQPLVIMLTRTSYQPSWGVRSNTSCAAVRHPAITWKPDSAL